MVPQVQGGHRLTHALKRLTRRWESRAPHTSKANRFEGCIDLGGGSREEGDTDSVSVCWGGVGGVAEDG